MLRRARHCRRPGREGTRPGDGADVGVHLLHNLFCSGVAAATSCLRRRARAFVRWQDADLHAVSYEAAVGVYRSMGGFARHWLPGCAVADRGRFRRFAWTRFRAREAETLVSALRTFGFYLRRRRRRV